MENYDLIIEHLDIMSKAIHVQEESLMVLIAYYRGRMDSDSTAAKDSKRQEPPTRTDCPFPQIDNLIFGKTMDQDGISFKSTETIIKEIKEMLITLKLKGSIRKRANGLLELRIYGLKSIYGRSKEELEQKLQAILKSKGEQKEKEKKKTPFLSEFFYNEYWPYKLKQGRAKNTLSGIQTQFKYIIENFDKRLNAYTAAEIEKFLLSIDKTRKRQMIQQYLNALFKRAMALSVIKSNPCAPLETMRHKIKLGSAFSFAEQLRFFPAIISDETLSLTQKIYFMFVYLTGTRRTEASLLKFDDIDTTNKVLSIHGTKTEGSERDIPLTPLVERLLDMIPHTGKYVFDFPSARADRILQKLMKQLGMKHKLHDLRHSFGTIQICVEKVDVKTVSLWLGHSTLDTTLRIYTHPEQLDKGTFLRGDLSDQEKNIIYRAKYNEVLSLFETFLLS